MNSKNICKFLAIVAYLFVFVIFSFVKAVAGEGPDELYHKGRYAEAEKAYAQLDMDHPKHVQYRYNRGCAAYMRGDYKGAAAAFASTLRRARDNKLRFMAAYNLGNTAFKQKDFNTAIACYKKAIIYNPESKDARYNLELALRELKKQEMKERAQKENTMGKKNKEQKGGNGEKGTQGTQPEKDKNKGDTKGNKDYQAHGKDQARGKTNHPESLSGKLRALNPLKNDEQKHGGKGLRVSSLDKRKAEALLDNIKENPSNMFRFILPKTGKRVFSGKDW